MNDPGDDLNPLVNLAYKAGEMLLAMQPEISATFDEAAHAKEDGSPVTRADKLAHALIVKALAKRFPGIPVLSEEDEPVPSDTALHHRFAYQHGIYFAVDPLDNTGSYVKGQDGWSVNLALIENGVPTMGALYFPARRELYLTRHDDGKVTAHCLHTDTGVLEDLEVAPWNGRRDLRVATGYREANVEHLRDRPHQGRTEPGQYRACTVARGDCDLTGLHGPCFHSWDCAAGDAVLRAAGGMTYAVSPSGWTPLVYPTDGTVLPCHVAASPDAARRLAAPARDIQPTR